MTFDISDDEALVLFELLHGYGSHDERRELKVEQLIRGAGAASAGRR